ncbi:MAG: nitroreductase family protein [bacterium]|nr:nitroreductase family protein [bacterium]
MDALEALKTRRSIREYTGDPVDRAVVEDIVDCGRLAATAINIQPWEFVAVTDAGMRKQIADTTEHGKFIADAPVCIAVLANDGKYYLEDGCAATQNILVAARAHGLGTCWIAGDKKPYADAIVKMLGAPDECKLVSLIALGVPAVTPDPTKRPIEDVLHWGTY